ncbi:MAG: hypothetical protein K2X47_13415, partial [Bdellovibrionales bacterium]|nr:hypothetical protein [Bdellovibrionales bacterium]
PTKTRSRVARLNPSHSSKFDGQTSFRTGTILLGQAISADQRFWVVGNAKNIIGNKRILFMTHPL